MRYVPPEGFSTNVACCVLRGVSGEPPGPRAYPMIPRVRDVLSRQSPEFDAVPRLGPMHTHTHTAKKRMGLRLLQHEEIQHSKLCGVMCQEHNFAPILQGRTRRAPILWRGLAWFSSKSGPTTFPTPSSFFVSNIIVFRFERFRGTPKRSAQKQVISLRVSNGARGRGDAAQLRSRLHLLFALRQRLVVHLCADATLERGRCDTVEDARSAMLASLASRCLATVRCFACVRLWATLSFGCRITGVVHGRPKTSTGKTPKSARSRLGFGRSVSFFPLRLWLRDRFCGVRNESGRDLQHRPRGQSRSRPKQRNIFKFRPHGANIFGLG